MCLLKDDIAEDFGDKADIEYGEMDYRYGKPIDVEEYEAEFMSGQEGAAKSAVKKLTKRLEMDMLKQTVNAHDW